MFNLKQTWESMRKERAAMQAELDRLDRAISALRPFVDGSPPTQVKPSLKRRELNKANKSDRRKSKISAQGLRNIVEAQKKRWARVKASAKSKGKVSKL
jgi:hypothetical protein